MTDPDWEVEAAEDEDKSGHPDQWRHKMLDVAALAVAAIESFDRKKNAV